MRTKRLWTGAVCAALTLAWATPAWAHVKWFSEFTFRDQPRTVSQALTPAFLALALLSIVVVAGLVPVDGWLERRDGYRRFNDALAARAPQSRLVMRVGTGMVLLLAWQADLMLVPRIAAPAPWIGWFEFLLAALLLFDATAALAGAGVLLLFTLAVAREGIYYMLDYLLVAGVGYYLLVTGIKRPRVAATGLPALYVTVGFSLCWVALEKVIWPEWGLYVLQQNPQLALGLDVGFFLVAAAFIEFCLGYLLIINLLQRPMALVITLTFFLTTMVFGKTEVIGHTLIHAALIVFILEGPGTTFKPPIALHRRTGLRTAFAAVNLVVLLAIMLPVYAMGAQARHRAALREAPAAAQGTRAGGSSDIARSRQGHGH